MSLAFADPTPDAIPIHFVTRDTWPRARRRSSRSVPALLLARVGSSPKPGASCSCPAMMARLSRVLFAAGEPEARGLDPFLAGELATRLPAGTYRFGNAPHDDDARGACLSARELSLRRYRSSDKEAAQLVAPDGIDRAHSNRSQARWHLGAISSTRRPTILGRKRLEDAIVALADKHSTRCTVVRGDDLLDAELSAAARGRTRGRASRRGLSISASARQTHRK